MQINGQPLSAELFVELISSHTWQIKAIEHQVYQATREEGSERLTIWASFSEVYQYLKAYWPRRINTIQYQALETKAWYFNLDTTGKHIEVRRTGQETVALWLPLNETTNWGQPAPLQGETFTLTTAIKNRSKIQSPEDYSLFNWARSYQIDAAPSKNTKEWKKAGGKRPTQKRNRSELTGCSGRPITIERLERFAFYERATRAFGVVATGETALYGNIILKMGVCHPKSAE